MLQEKIKTLTAEYDEREKEYKELHDELNDQMSRAKGTTNQHVCTLKIDHENLHLFKFIKKDNRCA